ncbi:MAG: hypothetical protein ACYC36_06045 [Bellilinea sp.]
MTLTRAEILAMPADELRVEIAKRRGWSDKEVLGSVFVYRGPNGELRPGYPQYTANIADAWALVEEMRKERHELEINTDRNSNGEDIYEVVILNPRHDGLGTGWTLGDVVISDTAPLAISRAWLLWDATREDV